MKAERYLPAGLLRPLVKAYMIIESKDDMENRILPDSSMVLAFRYKGKVTSAGGEGVKNSLPVSVITGLRRTPRLIGYSKGSANLLVLFTEGGAAAFFKQPLHELFERSLSLDHLVAARKINEIEERLAEAGNNPQRVAIVERFLLSELKEPRPDLLVLHAIQKIKSANGSLRIKELIRDLPVSLDPFEKRFRRVTGTSPKQFSAIVRLRSLIEHYTQANGLPGVSVATPHGGNRKSLTEAACMAGYFDQAHFIKDFKSFTGQTPLRFFQSPVYW